MRELRVLYTGGAGCCRRPHVVVCDQCNHQSKEAPGELYPSPGYKTLGKEKADHTGSQNLFFACSTRYR